MDEPIVICGLALPYGETALVRDDRWPGEQIVERFEPGAFNLDRSNNVLLRFADHDHGPEADAPWSRQAYGELDLWSDSVGLWFEARLAPARRGAFGIVAAVAGGTDGVSIFFRRTSERVHVGNDGWRQAVITAAELLHISIVANPMYAGTVCWPAEADLARRPGVQARAAQWAASRAARAPERPRARAASIQARGSRVTAPASVAAVLRELSASTWKADTAIAAGFRDMHAAAR